MTTTNETGRCEFCGRRGAGRHCGWNLRIWHVSCYVRNLKASKAALSVKVDKGGERDRGYLVGSWFTWSDRAWQNLRTVG